MTKTNEDLGKQIEALVAEHVAATRRLAREAVERAFGVGGGVKADSVRAVKGPTGGKKRRASADLAALGERFYRTLCARPGETMTVLAAEVGVSAGELHRAVARLKQAGRVRTVGERSATRYFPLGNSAAA